VADPAARAEYDGLSRALAAGEVGDEHLGALQRVLELGLRTGRVRRIHGALAEAALVRVFQGTPKGQAAAQAAGEVNAALEALAGHALERLTLGVRGPGAYTLTLETGAATLTIEMGAAGVAIKDVSVGA
jgi:hypothetical protein